MSDARCAGWLVKQTLKVNEAILKSIQDLISSQCNRLSVGVMWSRRCRPVTPGAWVFCIIWRFIMFLLVTPNVPSWRSPNEHWSANTLYFLLYLLLSLVGCGVMLAYDSMSFSTQILHGRRMSDSCWLLHRGCDLNQTQWLERQRLWLALNRCVFSVVAEFRRWWHQHSKWVHYGRTSHGVRLDNIGGMVGWRQSYEQLRVSILLLKHTVTWGKESNWSCAFS